MAFIGKSPGAFEAVSLDGFAGQEETKFAPSGVPLCLTPSSNPVSFTPKISPGRVMGSMRVKAASTVFIMLAMMPGVAFAAPRHADTIYVDGKIFTADARDRVVQ